MIEEIRQFDYVRAKFAPARGDDLRDGAASCLGKVGVFQAVWIIEDGDYAGQWAMMAASDWKFAWAPLCDLTDVEAIDDAEGRVLMIQRRAQ